MLENLIFDRTLENVNTIKELSKLRYEDMSLVQKRQWKENMKRGCYTYTDLNRVETAVEELGNKLRQHGYSVSLNVRKNWTRKDIPTQQDMERYINNISNIRKLNVCFAYTPQAPTNTNLTYIEANNIERILHDTSVALSVINEKYVYSGEIYSGGGYA